MHVPTAGIIEHQSFGTHRAALVERMSSLGRKILAIFCVAKELPLQELLSGLN